MREFRGCNYFRHLDDIDLSELDHSFLPPRMRIRSTDLADAQNNVLRLFKAAGEQRYEHPAVYIENGAHEFYPSERWRFFGAPSHNGDGYNYLTAPPPNLGEIDHPMSEAAGGVAILRFNGLWGTWGRFNSPPPGPPLHLNWTLVPGSASESRLKALPLGY